jgi:hypothetical protein
MLRGGAGEPASAEMWAWLLGMSHDTLLLLVTLGGAQPSQPPS